MPTGIRREGNRLATIKPISESVVIARVKLEKDGICQVK
jgi:hypothetical protein